MKNNPDTVNVTVWTINRESLPKNLVRDVETAVNNVVNRYSGARLAWDATTLNRNTDAS